MENLEKILGSLKREKKYEDIFPILWLILYRVYAPGKDRLFVQDGLYPDVCSIKSYLAFPLKYIVYISKNIWYMCLRNVKKKSEGLYLFSDSFLLSKRYVSLQKMIIKQNNSIGTFTLQDCGLPIIDRVEKKRRTISKSIKILPLGMMVVSWKNKINIEKCYDLFKRLVENNESCENCADYADRILDSLQISCNRDAKRIARRLKKYKIKKFITVNQFNIKDYMCIMACRNIGIKTVEYMHYTPLFIDTRKHWENQFQYVDEIAFWCEADMLYYKKYIEPKVRFYSDCKFKVYGSPELLEQEIEEVCQKYERKRNITLFVPANEELRRNAFVKTNELTAEDFQDVKARIFRCIDIFAKSNKIETVYLRYHPGVPESYENGDADEIAKYGFVVVDDTRDSLIKCLGESVAAFGVASSALYLASAYGCEVYAIDFGISKLDFCDIGNIKLVSCEQIETITLGSKIGIRKELCADVDMMFENIR